MTNRHRIDAITERDNLSDRLSKHSANQERVLFKNALLLTYLITYVYLTDMNMLEHVKTIWRMFRKIIPDVFTKILFLFQFIQLNK